jgi:hypothetical protein
MPNGLEQSAAVFLWLLGGDFPSAAPATPLPLVQRQDQPCGEAGLVVFWQQRALAPVLRRVPCGRLSHLSLTVCHSHLHRHRPHRQRHRFIQQILALA